VSPERVEEVLTAFAGVDDAAVFATDNVLGISELTALIVGPLAEREQAVREHCAARLPPSSVPVRLIAVAAIPRGGQGKIERHRLADFAQAAMASALTLIHEHRRSDPVPMPAAAPGGGDLRAGRRYRSDQLSASCAFHSQYQPEADGNRIAAWTARRGQHRGSDFSHRHAARAGAAWNGERLGSR